MFLSSHFSAFFNLSFVPFSPASSSSSFFCVMFCFGFLYFPSFFNSLFALSLCFSPLVSFQPFSIFWQSFISVVVLLSTFPCPSYLRHLSLALLFFSSVVFSSYLFSLPSCHSSPPDHLIYCHNRRRLKLLFIHITFRK